MLDATDIADRDQAMLIELAELDLSLARRVHACAMVAEPQAVGDLARSYQRIARSLRQTLALKARLKRDRDREAREAPAAVIPRDETRIRAREAEVRLAVQRVIWAERDREDEDEVEHADYLHDLLDERLEQRTRDNAFGLEPVDEQVFALCVDFSLSLETAARWRDLPDPEYDDENEDEDHNPSAARQQADLPGTQWQGSG